MRRLLPMWFALLVPALAFAQSVVLPGFPPGTFQSRAALDAGGTPPPSYTGPGDVVASAVFGGGLRAYSAATAGSKAINVCLASDVACADLSTDASTGALVITTVGGFSCAVVTCTVKTIYDQTGNNACSGSTPCDFTQATELKRGTLVVNCIGSLPCIATSVNSNPGYLTSGNSPGTAQPFTCSFVAMNTAPGQGALFSAKATVQIGYHSSGANVAFIYAGSSVPTATASDGAFHAIQAVFNNASSDIYVDGSTNPSNLGSSTGMDGASSIVLLTADIGSQPMEGQFSELWCWGSAFSSGQKSSMNSNQHSYWGF